MSKSIHSFTSSSTVGHIGVFAGLILALMFDIAVLDHILQIECFRQILLQEPIIPKMQVRVLTFHCIT